MNPSSDTLDRALVRGRPVSPGVLIRPPVAATPFAEDAGHLQNATFRLEALLESHQALLESDAPLAALETLRLQIQSELRRLQKEGVVPQCFQAESLGQGERTIESLRGFLRLRRSEQYRLLIECSFENPNPILRVDLRGTILDANRAGYAFADLLRFQLGGQSTEWFRQAASQVINRQSATVTELQCGGRDFALTLAPVTDAAYVYIYGYDVSNLKEASRTAELMAMQDPLTGLANRNFLRQRFDQTLADCHRKSSPLAVAFIDLDNFKHVNDSLGHAAGDRTLRSIAAVLRESFAERNTVARWGGDEFVVLFPEVKKREAYQECERLHRLVPDRTAKDSGCAVTLSFGVAGYPADAEELELLLQVADQHLFRVKRSRSRFPVRGMTQG